MFRISISGTHSAGKSTLAKEIISHYSKSHSVVEIKEVARQLIESGFKMSKDITEYGIVHYIKNYLKLERTLTGDILLSDRSLIDLLAYISVNVQSSKKIRNSYLSLIQEIVYLESTRFDLYIYLPVEFPLVEDGIRPSDIQYRHDVDEKIKELLNHYGLKFETIKGNVEQRKNQLINIIDEKIKSKSS